MYPSKAELPYRPTPIRATTSGTGTPFITTTGGGIWAPPMCLTDFVSDFF